VGNVLELFTHDTAGGADKVECETSASEYEQFNGHKSERTEVKGNANKNCFIGATEFAKIVQLFRIYHQGIYH
jgi:hypothetical protein